MELAEQLAVFVVTRNGSALTGPIRL